MISRVRGTDRDHRSRGAAAKIRPLACVAGTWTNWTSVPDSPDNPLEVRPNDLIAVARSELIDDESLAKLIVAVSDCGAQLMLGYNESRRTGVVRNGLARWISGRVAYPRPEELEPEEAQRLLRCGRVDHALWLLGQRGILQFEADDPPSQTPPEFIVCDDMHQLAPDQYRGAGVNRRWGHAIADIGHNALKATKKVQSRWGTIGADRDPIPMPIPLFAARNFPPYFRELSSAPIHIENVENAEATNGRAHGPFRTLLWEELPTETVQDILAWIEIAQNVDYDCRNTIGRALWEITRALWPRRKKWPRRLEGLLSSRRPEPCRTLSGAGHHRSTLRARERRDGELALRATRCGFRQAPRASGRSRRGPERAKNHQARLAGNPAGSLGQEASTTAGLVGGGSILHSHAFAVRLGRVEEYDAALLQNVAHLLISPDAQRIARRIGFGLEPRDRAPIDAGLTRQIPLLHPQ